MSLTWLLDRMGEWSADPCLAWDGKPTTYGELTELVSNWRATLVEEQVGPGSVVALCGDYSPHTCSLLLALIENGAILVPISPAAETQRDEFIEVAEVEIVMDVAPDGVCNVTRLTRRAENPLTLRLRAEGRPGLVLFSSGSTGKSKAALHAFDALLEKFKTRRQRMRTLTFLLLDHIGGLNTLFYTLSNGGVVVAVHDRDPDSVCKAIEEFGVEMLPTSPTFLNLLLITGAYSRYNLSSLRLITYGTEVMPESTLLRIAEIFPDVRLQQTYGLSEVGILRSRSLDSSSLWVKVGGEGFETRIVDGTLWIRAESAMLGYLNAPNPFDQDGWLNTGDQVEVDGEYLRILGRKSELINVGGQKVYPAEVESVLLQMTNVQDAVVVGEPNPISGQMVVARVNLVNEEDPAQFRKRMRTHCRDRLAAYKIPAKIEILQSAQHNQRFKRMRRATSLPNDEGQVETIGTASTAT